MRSLRRRMYPSISNIGGLRLLRSGALGSGWISEGWASPLSSDAPLMPAATGTACAWAGLLARRDPHTTTEILALDCKTSRETIRRGSAVASDSPFAPDVRSSRQGCEIRTGAAETALCLVVRAEEDPITGRSRTGVPAAAFGARYISTIRPPIQVVSPTHKADEDPKPSSAECKTSKKSAN